MTIIEAKELLTEIQCLDYQFEIVAEGDFGFLKATYIEQCVVTGAIDRQHTRKWRLSEHMTKSEIVQTALKCALTSAEHRVREHFQYKGELVYGPHFDVEALYELARQRRLDTRLEWPVDAVRL
jgi:hypothetical protein